MILQSPSLTTLITDRVEDGQKVTLMDILLKYDHQRSGEKLEFYDAYAEDLGITKEEALAYQS